MSEAKDDLIARLDHECQTSMATIASERARAEAAEAKISRLRAENEKMREALALFDAALKEAEAILGGEYALTNGPLFDMAENAKRTLASLSNTSEGGKGE